MNSRLPLCKWVAYASESWVFVATIEKRKRRRARDTQHEKVTEVATALVIEHKVHAI